MKKNHAVLLAMCAALLLAPLASEAATTVETFSGTGTLVVDLPGERYRDGTRFTGELTLSSLTFTSGAARLSGEDIDFSGQEADFMAETYSGWALVPAVTGPAKVSIRAYGSNVGLASKGDGCAGTMNAAVQLGPSFSHSYIDIPTTESVNTSGAVTSFASGSAALNGSSLSYISSYTVTSLDAATGIIDVYGQGSLLAESRDDVVSTASLVPTDLPLQPLGLGLVLVGFVGLAGMATSRLRSYADPSAEA